MSGFVLAEKSGAKLRILFDGPSGSGKTYSALRLARGIAGPDGRIGVIDTQNGQSLRYADKFRFGILRLAGDYHPNNFVKALGDAAAAKLDVVIIDSASHEWSEKGGCLALVDQLGRRSGGSATAWKDVTPLHQAFVSAIIEAPMHVIVTCRTKTAWEYVKEFHNGREKTVPKRIGMAIDQRDKFEYEFDLWVRFETSHEGRIEKSVIDGFRAEEMIELVTEDHGAALVAWIEGAREDLPPALDVARAPSRQLADGAQGSARPASSTQNGSQGSQEARQAAKPAVDSPTAEEAEEHQRRHADELTLDDPIDDEHDPSPRYVELPDDEGDDEGAADFEPPAGYPNPPEPKGRADADGVFVPDGHQRCTHGKSKAGSEQCPVVIDPQGQYAHSANGQRYEVSGATLIRISVEKLGRVYCTPHYTTARRLKEAGAAAASVGGKRAAVTS